MNSIKICNNDKLVKDATGGGLTYTDSYGEITHFASAVSLLLWWANTGGPVLSQDEKDFILAGAEEEELR